MIIEQGYKEDEGEGHYAVFIKLHWCPQELQETYPLSMNEDELHEKVCSDVKEYIDTNVGFTAARPKAMEITEYGEYIVDCYEY